MLFLHWGLRTYIAKQNARSPFGTYMLRINVGDSQNQGPRNCENLVTLHGKTKESYLVTSLGPRLLSGSDFPTSKKTWKIGGTHGFRGFPTSTKPQVWDSWHPQRRALPPPAAHPPPVGPGDHRRSSAAARWNRSPETRWNGLHLSRDGSPEMVGKCQIRRKKWSTFKVVI